MWEKGSSFLSVEWDLYLPTEGKKCLFEFQPHTFLPQQLASCLLPSDQAPSSDTGSGK